MDDEEDVKKMIEVIKCNKEENVLDFEYEEFINCDSSDVEENETMLLNDVEDLFSDLSSANIENLNTYDPRSSLKQDEKAVVDSCSDPVLKNILLLNRTKNMQLIQLYKNMKDLLIECQNNITDKTKIIKAHVEANKGQTNSTGAWRLAAPYFKDIQLYCSPPNADTLRKKSNKELSIYDLSSSFRWSNFECEKLVRAVKLHYNINQQNIVRKNIQEVNQCSSIADRKEQLEKLENRMEELNADEINEVPPLNSGDCIDWMRVSGVFLTNKHSAFESKSIWHIYLHPSINKSAWTPAENTRLKEIVKKHNYQNWDKIAEELGTNRTGFTACMNYYGNLHEKFKKGEFTYEEDARLLNLVYQYRMGTYIPWFKIVHHFKDRTRSQLHYRYTYYLSQQNKKKGKFTEAEDVLLMILVDKFGKNFKKCCEYLPTRSMVQCKSRFNSNLKGCIKKGSFTIEEDEVIMTYVEEHGTKAWTDLAEALRRSRGQIRQRYHTIKQFIDGNSQMTLDLVPRRKHNLKSEEESFHFLRIVADRYRDNPIIPSLREIQKFVRNVKKERGILNDADKEDSDDTEEFSTHSLLLGNIDIDDMLTDFFCNSFKINSQKSISSVNLKRAVEEVRTVLNILQVDLHIPDNFDDGNARLDVLDIAILYRLFEDDSKGTGIVSYKISNSEITKLMPPNMNNIVGLRSLLIKFSHYKSEENLEMLKFVGGHKKQHFVSNIRAGIVNHLLSLPPNIREDIESERKLFYKRFYTLFKWPAIMTLQGPSVVLQSVCRSTSMESPLPQVKRTYSRTDRKNSSDSVAKRTKLPDAPPPEPKTAQPSESVPLKLTPVTNKSVIEDLMRNKHKKLFCFDQLKCGDVVKTVIREVPLSIVNKKLISNKSSTRRQSKKCTVVNILDSPASTSSRQSVCESSSGNQELFQFNTGQGECVITDLADDESVISYGRTESVVDDEEDLRKLDRFLNEGCGQLQDEEDEDLKDLEKLDMFLKKEKDTSGDYSDESSLFG